MARREFRLFAPWKSLRPMRQADRGARLDRERSAAASPISGTAGPATTGSRRWRSTTHRSRDQRNRSRPDGNPDWPSIALVSLHQSQGGMMMTDVMTRPHQLIASDRVEGTAVRRPNGDKIGHIERLMIDKITGKVSYAILSFGGFLGMGTNLLPLPWAQSHYNTRFEAYELDIDDDELQARAVVPRRQGFRLGRSVAGNRTASLLRNTALLGRVLIASVPRCAKLRRAATHCSGNRSSRC